MRRRLAAACLAVAALACGCNASGGTTGAAGASTPGTSKPASPTPAPSSSAPRKSQPSPFAPILSGPHLRPGSDPSVLPADVLIADKKNNRLIVVDPQGRIRWEFPRPGDLRPGQTFLIPDDAFFTPDGRDIIATEEDDFVITVIDVATHHIVWRYGVPGHHGAGPNHLWNPDDAMVLPDGTVLSADIKNCRLVLIPHRGHRLLRQFGRTGSCDHDPPHRFGSPNGAFPMRDGDYLVTEINGDWVDEVSLRGAVRFSTHPPGVRYPSDTNEISPGQYLTVDYSRPGQLVVFDRKGRPLWRFKPTGADALDKPSLALPLPGGYILANDDANHRVIVVDRATKRIVWQYGVTGTPGRRPGYLDNPDGVDLVPPHSLLMRSAATMGTP